MMDLLITGLCIAAALWTGGYAISILRVDPLDALTLLFAVAVVLGIVIDSSTMHHTI